jgi:cell division FtsZ-interacting protein ZapD
MVERASVERELKGDLDRRQGTIREVAHAIGVDESCLSRFEAQASASLDVALLGALASYYQLTDPSELFEIVVVDEY